MMMASKTIEWPASGKGAGGGSLPESYFARVRAFPLESIRDDAHLRRARSVIDGLLREELDEGGEAYLGALTDLVGRFEDEHHPIPRAGEADMLRHLMESRQLMQRDLADQAGIARSTISEILSGKRRMTKDQLITLAEFFGHTPAVFLGK